MREAIAAVFNFFDETGGEASSVTLDKTFAYVTTGGDGTTAASGTFILSGDTITLTAAATGASWNGVNVIIVADAAVTGADPYDNVNKVITVHVKKDGTSTTTEVRTAINAWRTLPLPAVQPTKWRSQKIIPRPCPAATIRRRPPVPSPSATTPSPSRRAAPSTARP
jgi:hypothetical protein